MQMRIVCFQCLLEFRNGDLRVEAFNMTAQDFPAVVIYNGISFCEAHAMEAYNRQNEPDLLDLPRRRKED